MKTNIETTNKLTMISQMTRDSKFQVLEFERIDGTIDGITAIKVQEINSKNIKLRQLRIILEDSVLYIQNNKVSYYFGTISVKNKKSKPMSLSKKIFTGKLLEEYEDTIKPVYYGTGEIFLKPQFKNYALIELEDDNIVVYEENFIAAEGSVEIEAMMENGKVAYRLLGNGIVVLEMPVPEHEIFKCKLCQSELKTKNELVVLHDGDVEFMTEPDISSLDDQNISILNVYSGTGEVWVIPTKEVYNQIKDSDLSL